ncbi:MAG: DUF748 domain-containing protein [Deltaproteobacteria bacterium]|nr:DUF748 domain-containing protein [Deltaproteobacteria bacterium]MBW2724106.1 DUF748 domain-containing protein [Deltaproteobacteria bacterium]
MTAPQDEDLEPSRSRLGRLRTVVLALLAVSLLVRVTLPSVLIPAIENAGSGFLGVPVTIGNLDLAIFSGIFVIEDLIVGGVAVGVEPAPDDLLRLERLTLRIRWLSILGGNIDLARVRLTAPRVRLRTLSDGRLDASLLALGEGEPEAEPESPSDPTRIVIRHFELTDLDFEFRDTSTEPAAPVTIEVDEFSLDDLAFVAESIEIGSLEIEAGRLELGGDAPLGFEFNGSAEQITNATGRAFPLRVSFAMTQPASEGENPVIELEGEAAIDPPSFDGRLEYDALPLPLLLAPADLGLTGSWLRSGTASGALSIAIQPTSEGGQEMRLAGELEIKDFDFANSLDEEEKEIALAWKSLAVDLNEALVHLGADGTPLSPPEIHLTEISLGGPRAKFSQPSEALAALLGTEGEAVEAASEEPASGARESTEPDMPPASIRIDRIKIEQGSVDFLDRSTTPSFRGGFENLELVASQIDPLAGTAEKLDLSLSSGDGTLAVKGSLGEKHKLTIDLEKLELGPFNAYALTHAGYVIDHGQLTLRSVIQREGDLFKAENEIILHDFKVQDASDGGFQDQFGVSMAVGLALLRDIDGNIVLDVPVQSSLDETEFQLGPVVLDALRSAFVGALTSPLRIFNAAMFDDESETTQQLIQAEPESDDFSDEGREQIAQLADLLSRRPTLAVSMRGQVGPLDRDSAEFVPGDGRLDELAQSRLAKLNEILSEEFEIAAEQLRIDSQISVGDPGVAIELVPR